MEAQPASATEPGAAAAPEAAAAAAAPPEPEAQEASLKRSAPEGEAAAEGGGAEGGAEEHAAKRAKAGDEEGSGGPEEGAAAGGAGEGEGEEKGAVEPKGGEGSKAKEEVLKIGPKQFENGLAMFHFFFDLVKTWPLFQDVNEVRTFAEAPPASPARLAMRSHSCSWPIGVRSYLEAITWVYGWQRFRVCGGES